LIDLFHNPISDSTDGIFVFLFFAEAGGQQIEEEDPRSCGVSVDSHLPFHSAPSIDLHGVSFSATQCSVPFARLILSCHTVANGQ